MHEQPSSWCVHKAQGTWAVGAAAFASPSCESMTMRAAGEADGMNLSRDWPPSRGGSGASCATVISTATPANASTARGTRELHSTMAVAVGTPLSGLLRTLQRPRCNRPQASSTLLAAAHHSEDTNVR